MRYGVTVHDAEEARARSARWERLVARWARDEGEGASLQTLPSAEAVEVVDIMEALVTGRDAVHVVNVPNQGAIDNLPPEAIVEVSSLVGGYGVQPVHVGLLPEPLAATLRQHITAQELTVEAALTGDHHIALQAFLQDPQTAARLTPEETEALLDELLGAHAGLLPQFE
jgi:alpha-galactosidase